MLYRNTHAGTVLHYRNMNADSFMNRWQRLGYRLKTTREDLGLTQEELSALSGISRGYISKLEKGRKENPSIVVLKALAKALSVELSYLAESDFIYGNSDIEDKPPKQVSELLQLYEAMPETDQQTILDLARRLAASNSPRIIGNQ